MKKQKLACIILAAGQGKRMKSALPKALHPLAGRPMIGWLLESVQALKPEKIVVVTAPGMDALADAVKPHKVAIQKTPRGTGDAVKAALPALKGFKGDVLILLGDMPLISPATLRALIKAKGGGELAVLGANYDPPPAFGRLVMKNGTLEKIVEDKDCTPAQKKITLCNTGAFCVDAASLARFLPKLKNNNAQKEFYITDIAAMAKNARVHILADNNEARGVNSRADLAALESLAQQDLRAKAMEGGATFTDPASVYFSFDTKLGRDVSVEPNVFFGPGVTIGDNVLIRSFSHIEGAKIKDGAEIGPFARIRPKSEIGKDVRIGNFTEINRSVLKDGATCKHLSYLGDATICEDANIGAGTVIANYDGVNKHNTVIGRAAFTGSNSTIVAPVTVGDNAYIAAGSTITKDVPGDALAVARAKPAIIEGWAAKKRKKK